MTAISNIFYLNHVYGKSVVPENSMAGMHYSFDKTFEFLNYMEKNKARLNFEFVFTDKDIVYYCDRDYIHDNEVSINELKMNRRILCTRFCFTKDDFTNKILKEPNAFDIVYNDIIMELNRVLNGKKIFYKSLIFVDGCSKIDSNIVIKNIEFYSVKFLGENFKFTKWE